MSWGTVANMKKYARLLMRDEYTADATDAAANAITVHRSFSSVEHVWLNGTEITTYTATQPRTIAFVTLSDGDSVITEYIDASVPSDTIDEYLTHARSYIAGRVESAGYDSTTVTGTVLDMLVEKWAASELLMAEITRDRQTVNEYPKQLQQWCEDTLKQIASGKIKLIDGSGDVQDTSGDIAVVQSSSGYSTSEIRDSDGDWDVEKW